MGDKQSKEEDDLEEWLTEEDWAEFHPGVPLDWLSEAQLKHREERMKQRVEERKAEREAEREEKRAEQRQERGT